MATKKVEWAKIRRSLITKLSKQRVPLQACWRLFGNRRCISLSPYTLEKARNLQKCSIMFVMTRLVGTEGKRRKIMKDYQCI